MLPAGMIPSGSPSTPISQRPPGKLLPHRSAGAGVSGRKDGFQRDHVTRGRADGLAKRGYLTVEMGSPSPPRAAPAPSPSSCLGGARKFKVAAVARLSSRRWTARNIIVVIPLFLVIPRGKGRPPMPLWAVSLSGWLGLLPPPGVAGRTPGRSHHLDRGVRPRPRGSDGGGGCCRTWSPHWGKADGGVQAT